MQIDGLDRKILSEFDRNARRSLSEVSRKLKIGRERLDYRLRRLQDRGIVCGFKATVNPQKMGYQIYKTYLRLENNKRRSDQLIRTLRAHPYLSWLAVTDGSWDLLFCLYAREATHFYAMHTDILSSFNDIVLSFSSYTMTTVKMYQRGYLSEGQKSFVPLCGPQGHATLDEVDYAIVRSLLEDAWCTNHQLAENSGASVPTVAARLRQLEAEEIITGYRVDLDLQHLGLLFFKSQFYLRNYDKKLRSSFERYCDRHPYIICYSEQVGDCNIEIELHVPKYEDYAAVMEDIRSRFADFIRHYDTLMIRRGFYEWLPRAMEERAAQGIGLDNGRIG